LTKLVVEKLGRVEEAEVEALLATLRRLYGSVEDPPLLVYVVVAGDRRSFNSFLASLHSRWRVASTPGFEGFEAAHDAYTGVPRLALCLEELRVLPRLVVDGVVLHEAAHTVLHGCLDAYSPPRGVLRAAEELEPRLRLELAYLAAASVKDYEASKLLVERGFHEEARAYVLHELAKLGGLEAEWRASLQLGVPLLHLAELLKPLCCAAPLLSDGAVVEAVEAYLAHLPSWASEALRRLVEDPSWTRRQGLWSRVEALLQGLAELRRSPLHSRSTPPSR